MAKKSRNEEKFNYGESIRRLRQDGPQRLYLIWGPEDYLAEQYLAELRKLCVTNEADDFSYRKIGERDFSALALTEAIDSVPFLSERSLVEVRGVDLNKLEQADDVMKAISDIPDYCTVVFLCEAGFEPDKRLKLFKTFAKSGVEIHVTAQLSDALIKWIVKRFAAQGKSIELNAAQRLITVSGELMSRLIPEINKIAAYAKGEKVTVDDVNAVAHHIPEAVVFDMTECMARGEYNAAMSLLGELLDDKNNEPIMILAVLGNQMRQLYTASVAVQSGLGKDYLMKTCSIKYDFVASKLINSARKFNQAQLRRAVELCAETDYAMKSSRTEPKELLKECIMRIAADEIYE